MGQGDSILVKEISTTLNITDNDDLKVQVIINNVLYKVSTGITPETSLNTFIRDVAKLKGTKSMCLEGGCGACIVAAEVKGKVISVNSCLVPVIICDGWKITTIEGIGNRKIGYHTFQAALADMNGSQCGFCSPGWVMQMFSLPDKSKMTMKEIENSFASNLCRCTGYRPILDAFKSFANDAPPEMREKIRDIEDLYKIKSCNDCSKTSCSGSCNDLEIVYKLSIPRSLTLHLKDSRKFYKCLKVDNVFEIFGNCGDVSCIIVGGNTGQGVYRLKNIQIYIDVNDIPDLCRVEKNKDTLVLGANVSLSKAKSVFEKYMNEPGFEYMQQMSNHIDLVASIPVRNIGTIAGNLMLKNQYHEFPSDIFLILETAGVEVHILDSPSSKTNMTLLEFFTTNMYKKLIYSLIFRPLSKEYVYKTYKIMPRAQNAHAIVNAGFLFKLDNNGTVLEKPNIIFGGINPEFLHASKTEEFLQGKSIYDNKILQEALKTLDSELNPDYVLPDPKPGFRKLLAVCLLYKFVLGINPNKVTAKLRSGGTLLKRELSSGIQEYDTDRNLWPINQPIPKFESIYQTSGEGEYINDLMVKDNEVFCALTLAETLGEIVQLDCEEALNIDGVIAFYSAKDIPGKNTFVYSGNKHDGLKADEILFADKEVAYAGQPFGIIVAESQQVAQYAATKVKIVYPNGPRRKPLITVHDVLASNDKTRIIKAIDFPASQPAGKNQKYKIKGTYECGSQFHFTMETQTCVCVPSEDGMDVFSATQWMDLTQTNIAVMLNVPVNSIHLQVRRLGGGYGSKISRATQIACSCALVCHLQNRPARLVMSIESNMKSLGKRTPAYMEYELSVDDMGKIQKLDATYYGNVGTSFNESHAYGAINHFYNCYDKSTWSLIGQDLKTDIPSNTWCRSPGSAEGVSMIEHIMERIARTIGKNNIEVRTINMNDTDKQVLQLMIDELKKASNYDERVKDILKFNNENRWKKRGISLVPMKYALELFGQFHAIVSVYARDGTVSISSGGIEMGQGLYSKLKQITAYTLGIDVKMVNVKPSTSLTAPNNLVTGGSVGSDTCGYATQMACKQLLDRLKPIKETLGESTSWQELVNAAFKNEVDLCSSYMYKQQEDVKSYPIFGAAVSEVEVDILTGQHLIRRVDIIEDAGISLNPKIDVGQVEGAFIMGVGYWTCEDLIYDPETGVLKNHRTWNYKIPGAKDIPVDFRITFRRNAPNPCGILRSKTAGEPPLCMSCSVPIAIRHALDSARSDAGNTDIWYQLDNALTVEKILMNSLTKIDEMLL